MTDSILELVGIVTVRAENRKFEAREVFQVNPALFGEPSRLNGEGIHWGDGFCSAFLLGYGKIEPPRAEMTLRVHRVKKRVTHLEIISALGGEDVAETTLGDLWTMMARQPWAINEGLLLIENATDNVFYIRNDKGILCEVHCSADWRRDGWHLMVYPVEKNDSGMGAGDHVISL